ncbi:hypothetical protein DFH09DRAFT_1436627 [Mycena vulgaris]|nr:hypothetical protein DFH09DRAFT_1436627 [Mycena vulgaris]
MTPFYSSTRAPRLALRSPPSSTLPSRVSLLTVPSPALPLFPLPCHSSSLSLVPFASPPSLLFLPSAFPAHDIVLPSLPSLPSAFSPSRATLATPSSPLYLALLPRSLRPPHTSTSCSCVASLSFFLPAIPILSPRVLVPPPRIHTLLIPAPFYPHSVLPCFLPVQSPHPPPVLAPLLPCPHPSASPSISLSYLTALPLFPPLPPSPFPLPALRSALPSASSPSSPPHLRPHPHPPLSISSVYPRKR